MPRHSPRPTSGRDGRHRPLDLPATCEPVVQVWAARTTGLRGLLAVHCWLLLKPGGHAPFERWDVVGRRARTGRIGLQRNVRSPREGWDGREASLVLDLRLAIGKDWLVGGGCLASAPSGTGWQLSFLGLAGVLVAAEEGVELSLGGLVCGWRRRPAALLLPGLGELPLRRPRLNRPFSQTG